MPCRMWACEPEARAGPVVLIHVPGKDLLNRWVLITEFTQTKLRRVRLRVEANGSMRLLPGHLLPGLVPSHALLPESTLSLGGRAAPGP